MDTKEPGDVLLLEPEVEAALTEVVADAEK
jgi:hypothetical protein